MVNCVANFQQFFWKLRAKIVIIQREYVKEYSLTIFKYTWKRLDRWILTSIYNNPQSSWPPRTFTANSDTFVALGLVKKILEYPFYILKNAWRFAKRSTETKCGCISNQNIVFQLAFISVIATGGMDVYLKIFWKLFILFTTHPPNTGKKHYVRPSTVSSETFVLFDLEIIATLMYIFSMRCYNTLSGSSQWFREDFSRKL